MAYKELRAFNIKSLVKVYVLLMGVFGLILGILYGIVGNAIDPTTGLPVIVGGFNFKIFIVTLGTYIAMGALMGLITGALYNYIAKKVGGIKIDLK